MEYTIIKEKKYECGKCNRYSRFMPYHEHKYCMHCFQEFLVEKFPVKEVKETEE